LGEHQTKQGTRGYKDFKINLGNKKEVSGMHCAWLNMCRYKQVDSKDYDEDSKFAPVVTDATSTHIILIHIVMAG
jgi:hypothetical protein